MSSPQGQAGNLNVTANSMFLDNGNITAVTGKSQGSGGANITLQVQDNLRMVNNSLISANALDAADGGNINIHADFILTASSENSDIIANAIGGNGGRIDITASGILGNEFRQQQTPFSDITASSEEGEAGVVNINTPDVDPNRGLVNLPAKLVQVSELIANGCAAVDENKFIVTGRGGLPENPTDPLFSDAVQVDLVTLNPREENRSSPRQSPQRGENTHGAGSTVSTHPTNPAPAPLVEAQGWVINNKGEVVLTAHAPTDMSYVPWLNQPPCNES